VVPPERGLGHDLQIWRQIVSALRIAGYDDVLSIERQDGLAAPIGQFPQAVYLAREANRDVLGVN